MTPELEKRIREQISSAPIFVYMKGTKDFPMCGFSATVVGVLKELGVPFSTFNVLSDESIRQGIKEFSNWPTIPQVYLKGEFIGGCDIILDMHQRGELAEKTKAALEE